MTDTLAYYNNNAGQFFAETVEVKMVELYNRFHAQVPASGQVLDAGCGSGRDSNAFLRRGYHVTTFGASPQLAELASKHLGHPVSVRTFAKVVEKASYDGIWGCASTLHR
jgi:2-polyprenyl-3-methyl-5-hydroxy-6-metoxy-1,4-benzoquinol methylase